MNVRHKMTLTGTIVALASIVLASRPGDDLVELTVVGGIVTASALLAEGVGIVAAVFEIMLGFIAGLAGMKESSLLDIVALLGGSLLMFMAGLEIDPRLMRRYMLRSLAMGTISFTAPMAATYLALSLLGYPLRDSLLAAIGVSTTSVAVVYTITRRHGVISSMRGQVLLASAMTADVLSILAFSVIVLEPNPLLLIYIIVLLASPPLVAKILDSLPPSTYESEVRVILAIVMAATLFSEAVGVHGILFSFLLGTAISGGKIKHRVEQRLGPFIMGFLAPVFFVNAGLHIAPVGIARLWRVTVILLAVSYPAKLLATYVALRVVAKIRGWRLSNVMAARLTVSTIIAYAGLKGGLIGYDLAAGIMASALIATIVSSLGSSRL